MKKALGLVAGLLFAIPASVYLLDRHCIRKEESSIASVELKVKDHQRADIHEAFNPDQESFDYRVHNFLGAISEPSLHSEHKKRMIGVKLRILADVDRKTAYRYISDAYNDLSELKKYDGHLGKINFLFGLAAINAEAPQFIREIVDDIYAGRISEEDSIIVAKAVSKSRSQTVRNEFKKSVIVHEEKIDHTYFWDGQKLRLLSAIGGWDAMNYISGYIGPRLDYLDELIQAAKTNEQKTYAYRLMKTAFSSKRVPCGTRCVGTWGIKSFIEELGSLEDFTSVFNECDPRGPCKDLF